MKDKDIILWDAKFETKYYDLDISRYLTDTMKKLPLWYKDIKLYDNFSIKRCPSFIELFKNSYTIISPTDFTLKFSKSKRSANFLTSNENKEYLSLETHTINPIDGIFQMNYFNPDFQNVKLSFPLAIRSKKGRIDAIMFSNFYHNPSYPLQAAPGIWPLIDDYTNQFNVNFFINWEINKNLEVKKGDPLALMYFPNGKPELEKAYLKEELHENIHYRNSKESGFYLKKMAKCPYNH